MDSMWGYLGVGLAVGLPAGYVLAHVVDRAMAHYKKYRDRR